MKHLPLLFLFILSGSLYAQTIDTISGPDGKISKYYYPEGWYDTCIIYYETDCTPESGRTSMTREYGGLAFLSIDNIPSVSPYGLNPFDGINTKYAHEYYAREPMAITGVAIMMSDISPLGTIDNDYYIDTVYPDTVSILLPDDNGDLDVVASAQIRWDTARRQVLKLPVNADSLAYGFRYCYLHELKFDHPVVVDSLYYIVGTSWNRVKVDMFTHHYLTTRPYYHVAMFMVCPHQRETYPYYDLCNPNILLMGEMQEGKFSVIGVDDVTRGSDWWGPYLLLVDSATIEVASANLAMGTAGPTRRMSKWVSQTITATPEIGYLFSHWNDGSTENPRDIYLTQDTQFTAYFEPNTRHTVRTRCEPEGMGIASGDGQYWRGDTVTLRATPAAPYHFSHWNDSNRTNPRRFAIEQDTAFTAVFTQQLPPDTTASLPQPLLNEAAPLFTLTPNPTTGEVTVTLGEPPLTLTHSSVSKADSWLHWRSPTFGSPNLGEQLRRMTLTIHDAAGNEVMRKELVRPGISIDLSAFPAGVYFVTLVTPTASGTQKLVVK